VQLSEFRIAATYLYANMEKLFAVID